MHSSLIRSRSIAFDSSDTGANLGGAASAAPAETAADDGEAGGASDDGAAGDEDKRPEWQKRIDSIREKATDATDGATPKDDKDKAGAAAHKPSGKPKDDDDESKPLVFKVPGRKDGEDDLELPIDRAKLKEMGLTVKEARDRVGQLRNGYKRAAEVEAERADIADGRRELDEIVTEMRERPVPFFLDNVDPKQYKPLAEALISRLSDAEFAVVVRKVAEYDADGSRRRLDGANAREEAANRRDEKGRNRDTEKKRDDYVKAVTTKINSAIPEDWSDEQAEEFFEYATFKLQTHAKKTGSRGIAPEEIPALLKSLGVLSHFDLEEPQVPARRTPPASRNAPPPRKPAPSGKPRDTAADLQERRDSRRAAATAPGGAGAAAQAGPPKGQSFADRIKYVREKFGVKKK